MRAIQRLRGDSVREGSPHCASPLREALSPRGNSLREALSPRGNSLREALSPRRDADAVRVAYLECARLDEKIAAVTAKYAVTLAARDDGLNTKGPPLSPRLSIVERGLTPREIASERGLTPREIASERGLTPREIASVVVPSPLPLNELGQMSPTPTAKTMGDKCSVLLAASAIAAQSEVTLGEELPPELPPPSEVTLGEELPPELPPPPSAASVTTELPPPPSAASVTTELPPELPPPPSAASVTTTAIFTATAQSLAPPPVLAPPRINAFRPSAVDAARLIEIDLRLAELRKG